MAYDPSVRRDSGTTRSKAARIDCDTRSFVFSRKDWWFGHVTRVMMRYTGAGNTGGEWRSKTNGGSVVVGDLISGIAVSVTLFATSPCVVPSCSVKEKMRCYAVLVTGPAGAGKSTFCASFLFNPHLQASKRSTHLVENTRSHLPLAPDSFEYAPSIDIKDLPSPVDDVMSELGYGPNGGLVYCFEYVSAPFAPLERRSRAFSGGAQIPLAEYGLARGGSRRI